MEAARPATTGDRPTIVALAASAAAELAPTRGGSLWQRRDFRAAPYEASIAVALTDPAQLVAVGTIDGVVLGYGVVREERLRDEGRLAVVDDLYVEPAARGVGIGAAIMDLLLAWSGERGCLGIDALALPGNRATKNFFERYGLTARAIVVHRSFGHPEPSGP
ncbi:MAG: GNAT family N-acetyltransferase [Acidimicrobiales bacterium]